MSHSKRWLHQCVCSSDQLCAHCELIDLVVDILNCFNKRPDFFHDTCMQQLISRAILTKMSIEQSRGVIRSQLNSEPNTEPNSEPNTG